MPAPVNHNLFPLLHSASFSLTSFFSLHKDEVIESVNQRGGPEINSAQHQVMHCRTHCKLMSMHSGFLVATAPKCTRECLSPLHDTAAQSCGSSMPAPC